MTTIRQALEDVWNRPGVLSPTQVVRWTEAPPAAPKRVRNVDQWVANRGYICHLATLWSVPGDTSTGIGEMNRRHAKRIAATINRGERQLRAKGQYEVTRWADPAELYRHLYAPRAS